MIGENTDFKIAQTNKGTYTFIFKNKRYGVMIHKVDYPTREEAEAAMNEFVMQEFKIG